MRSVELVFRTIGERTSDLALELALERIAPERLHLIENVQPFSEAVRRSLEIEYRSEFIVFMDADCLILEDMRPFLNRNTHPYVDCYVLDKFRGRIHAGVHITRLDVVREMQQIRPPRDDLKYVLRPESRLRSLALRRLGLGKEFAVLKILHDYFQYYHHIFCKYALRELRSRTPEQRSRLDIPLQQWPEDDLDYVVARRAVEFARRRVDREQSPADVARFVADLPGIARQELRRLSIEEKPPLTVEEVRAAETTLMAEGRFDRARHKVFGIGLSRTGSKSLTQALNLLNITVAHNPADQLTFDELTTGRYRLSLLDHSGFDGLTDIPAAAFYPHFDRHYPGSKFILTVRDRDSWLDAMERHWHDKPLWSEEPSLTLKLEMRRFLRASVYGVYAFNRERLSHVYDAHLAAAMKYFRGRPGSLLVLNICDGEGWEKLCSFLGLPLVDAPFPHVRKKTELERLQSPPGGGPDL